MNFIPPITDPLGKYWAQPDPKNILIDDERARMSIEDWNKLKIYNFTFPTGVYAGKMWGSEVKGTKYLHWFGEIYKDDVGPLANFRVVMII